MPSFTSSKNDSCLLLCSGEPAWGGGGGGQLCYVLELLCANLNSLANQKGHKRRRSIYNFKRIETSACHLFWPLGSKGREEGTLTAGSSFSVCSIQFSSVSKSLGPWYFTASCPGLKNFRLKEEQGIRKSRSWKV
jgi:hypothetical protein